MTTTECCGRA